MSLLRTAGRVAVASSVHGRVQRRQQARWAQQDPRGEPGQPQQVPAPQASTPSAAPKDPAQQLELLTKLGELRKAGVLTEDEFARKKAEILAG